MKKLFFLLFTLIFLLGLKEANAVGEINVLKLNGNENIILEIGIGYNDPKAIFTDQLGQNHVVEPDITITKDHLPGLYLINYKYTDEITKQIYSTQRYVEVTDPLNLIANFTFNNMVKNNYSINDIQSGVVLNDGSLIAYSHNNLFLFDNNFNLSRSNYINYILEKIIAGHDDGFIAVGSANSKGIIIKYNQDRTEDIRKLVESNYYNNLIDVIKTSDGNFMALGWAYVNGQKNIYLAKFDKDLDLLWDRTLYIDEHDYKQIAKTSDGGFILLSTYLYPINQIIVKIDKNGEYQSTKVMESSENYTSIKSMPDGDILLVGGKNNKGLFNKINSNGVSIWKKEIEWENSIINDYVVNDANEIIAVGNNSHGIMVKLDIEGNLIQKRIAYDSEVLNSVIEYSNNKYIVFGDDEAQISRIIDNGQSELNLSIDSEVKYVEIHSTYDELSIFKLNDNLNINVDKSENYLSTIGIHNVVYTLTLDNFIYYLNRQVIVQDTIDPMISGLKESFTVEAGSNKPNYAEGISVTDNSLEDIEVTIDDSAVDLDKVGKYYVRYIAKDSSNNETIEKVLVDVVDTIAPVITIDDTLTLEASIFSPLWEEIIETTDNSKDLLTYETNDENLNYRQVGEYDITIAVTDKGDNSAYKPIHLIIIDTTKPVLSNKVIYYEVYQLAPNWNEFLPVTDNSNDTLVITVDDTEVHYNKLGNYKVYFTSTDNSNNELDDYLVLNIIDSQKPIIKINLPNNKLIIERNAPHPDFFSFITASDNYTTILDIEVDDSEVNYSKPGKYVITIQVQDSSENIAVETMHIIIEKTPLDKTLEITIPIIVFIITFGGIIIAIRKLDGK